MQKTRTASRIVHKNLSPANPVFLRLLQVAEFSIKMITKLSQYKAAEVIKKRLLYAKTGSLGPKTWLPMNENNRTSLWIKNTQCPSSIVVRRT